MEINTYELPAAQLKTYVHESSIEYPVVPFDNDSVKKLIFYIRSKIDIPGVPTMLFFDKNGQYRGQLTGINSQESIQKILDEKVYK